jgi:hypothetical protein
MTNLPSHQVLSVPSVLSVAKIPLVIPICHSEFFSSWAVLAC